MPLGAEIRRRREEQGLSLTDLARMAGVSKGYLSQIENEAAPRPSAQTMLKIARALGSSLGELWGDPALAGRDAEPEVDIPPSLQEYARRQNIPEEDLRMLARIRYRGRVPRTPEDWHFIYESIRRSTEGP